MIAIETRYLGPTYKLGSRIVARDANGQRKTIPYDCSLSEHDAHRKAAIALLARSPHQVDLPMYGGWLGKSMVWVWADDTCRIMPDEVQS